MSQGVLRENGVRSSGAVCLRVYRLLLLGSLDWVSVFSGWFSLVSYKIALSTKKCYITKLYKGLLD